MKMIQQLINYNEVRYQYTLLQYNDQVVKVYVCRPVAVSKEFTKSMPPGDLTYNRAVLVRAPSGASTEAVRMSDGDSPVAGRF